MQFVECTTKDVALLSEISEKTCRDTFSQFNSTEDMDKFVAAAYAPQKLEKEISNSASLFFFAVDDGKVVGYIKLNFAPVQTELQDDKSIELERIYLLKDGQGKGHGKLLLEKAISIACKYGKEYIWLGVWEHNQKALAFYKRNGFYRFGRHPFVFGDDVQTDLLMRKDI